MDVEKLKNELPTLQTGFKPTAFVRDGLLIVSAEEGDGAADYYGEFHDGDPWIDPELEKFAKKNGCFWEWENPGAISLAN
jgi:hypothetical protein